MTAQEWIREKVQEGFTLTQIAKMLNKKGVEISYNYLYRLSKGIGEWSRKKEREILEAWT